MPFFHLGPAGDAFAGTFGAVAALLLLGGPLALRWQRNRQQFELAKAALAQGVRSFPKGQPFWLASLRYGIVTLCLGVALMVIGIGGCWWTWNLDLPLANGTQAAIAATTPATAALPVLEPAEPPLAMRIGPPAPNPALEEWHRLKAVNSLAMMSVATGFVLVVLGLARIGFVRTERKHEPDANQS